MGLFRRKKELATVGAPVGKLAGRLLLLQSRIAAWLNGRTIGYSQFKWLVLLIIFCISIGAACTYLIISSIY